MGHQFIHNFVFLSVFRLRNRQERSGSEKQASKASADTLFRLFESEMLGFPVVKVVPLYGRFYF